MMRFIRFIYTSIKALGVFVFASIALFCASTSVFAADPSDGDGYGGKEYPEVEGLPQLDFTTYPSQIFWLFTAFVILYLFFSKKTLPEISSTLEGRRQHVQSDLDNASRLKQEAEDVQTAYEEGLAKARAKASEQFKNTDDKIKSNASKSLDAFKARAEQALEEAEKQLEKTKKDAIADMHDIAAEVASIAAEKIVGVSTDLDNAKTVVKNIDKKAA